VVDRIDEAPLTGLYKVISLVHPRRERLGYIKSKQLVCLTSYERYARQQLALLMLSKDVSDLVDEAFVLEILCFNLRQLLEKFSLFARETGRGDHGN
jgi:hypothetical protein